MELPTVALSIRQPWAWLIVNGYKDIENRNWRTRFRGPVLIHASLGMTRDEYDDCVETCHRVARSRPFPEGTAMPAFKALERGGIIGVADVVGCYDGHDSPWFFGAYGFELANARPLPFMPMKGALSFFKCRYA